MDISSLKRKNFNAHDCFKSSTAEKKGILNIPTAYYMQKTLDNLNRSADKAQEIRSLLGVAVNITSWFRCIELNKEVGGKETSQHIDGEAFDFIAPRFGTAAEIVAAIKKSEIEVDQCIIEKSGKKEWVHCSIKRAKNRNQFATLIDGVFTVI